MFFFPTFSTNILRSLIKKGHPKGVRYDEGTYSWVQLLRLHVSEKKKLFLFKNSIIRDCCWLHRKFAKVQSYTTKRSLGRKWRKKQTKIECFLDIFFQTAFFIIRVQLGSSYHLHSLAWNACCIHWSCTILTNIHFRTKREDRSFVSNISKLMQSQQ